jgi:hypothetical protein
MTTLYQRISDTFLSKLSDAKEIDAMTLAQLHELLADGNKLKVDDLVRIFSGSNSDEIK